MKWRAFSRMPQWVRLSEWLGVAALRLQGYWLLLYNEAYMYKGAL